jgi:hypothetical protein
MLRVVFTVVACLAAATIAADVLTPTCKQTRTISVSSDEGSTGWTFPLRVQPDNAVVHPYNIINVGCFAWDVTYDAATCTEAVKPAIVPKFTYTSLTDTSLTRSVDIALTGFRGSLNGVIGAVPKKLDSMLRWQLVLEYNRSPCPATIRFGLTASVIEDNDYYVDEANLFSITPSVAEVRKPIVFIFERAVPGTRAHSTEGDRIVLLPSYRSCYTDAAPQAPAFPAVKYLPNTNDSRVRYQLNLTFINAGPYVVCIHPQGAARSVFYDAAYLDVFGGNPLYYRLVSLPDGTLEYTFFGRDLVRSLSTSCAALVATQLPCSSAEAQTQYAIPSCRQGANPLVAGSASFVATNSLEITSWRAVVIQSGTVRVCYRLNDTWNDVTRYDVLSSGARQWLDNQNGTSANAYNGTTHKTRTATLFRRKGLHTSSMSLSQSATTSLDASQSTSIVAPPPLTAGPGQLLCHLDDTSWICNDSTVCGEERFTCIETYTLPPDTTTTTDARACSYNGTSYTCAMNETCGVYAAVCDSWATYTATGMSTAPTSTGTTAPGATAVPPPPGYKSCGAVYCLVDELCDGTNCIANATRTSLPVTTTPAPSNCHGSDGSHVYCPPNYQCVTSPTAACSAPTPATFTNIIWTTPTPTTPAPTPLRPQTPSATTMPPPTLPTTLPTTLSTTQTPPVTTHAANPTTALPLTPRPNATTTPVGQSTTTMPTASTRPSTNTTTVDPRPAPTRTAPPPTATTRPSATPTTARGTTTFEPVTRRQPPTTTIGPVTSPNTPTPTVATTMAPATSTVAPCPVAPASFQGFSASADPTLMIAVGGSGLPAALQQNLAALICVPSFALMVKSISNEPSQTDVTIKIECGFTCDNVERMNYALWLAATDFNAYTRYGIIAVGKGGDSSSVEVHKAAKEPSEPKKLDSSNIGLIVAGVVVFFVLLALAVFAVMRHRRRRRHDRYRQQFVMDASGVRDFMDERQRESLERHAGDRDHNDSVASDTPLELDTVDVDVRIIPDKAASY